jgi:hypothetical protein
MCERTRRRRRVRKPRRPVPRSVRHLPHVVIVTRTGGVSEAYRCQDARVAFRYATARSNEDGIHVEVAIVAMGERMQGGTNQQ